MAKLYEDTDKYGYQSDFPIVEAYNSAIKDLVRQRFAGSGKQWDEFLSDDAFHEITSADMSRIEESLLGYGYRFEPSAMSSAIERPDAYKDSGLHDPDFSFEHELAPTAPTGDDGRELRGAGDNVVTRNENVIGVARYVRTSDKVLEYLTDGVPENTVAIVDDSGGTLTAPILEKFKAVICAGGTTRSHLAILTREYGIPCFMNARLSGINEGDNVEVEAVATAKSGDDYAADRDVSGLVWRIHS